jgi:hypothetical protein
MILRSGTTETDRQARLARARGGGGDRLENIVRLESCGDSTGVYLGPGKDGRTGYILTCAHSLKPLFQNPGGDPEESLAVMDYADIRFALAAEAKDAPATLEARAERFILHPGYQMVEYDEAENHPGDPYQRDQNDLALIAFRLDGGMQETLARNGHHGARLLEAEVPETRDQVQLAQVAGFGNFAWQDERNTATPPGLLQGWTYVTYRGWGSYGRFNHWSPASPTVVEGYLENRRVGNPCGFVSIPAGLFTPPESDAGFRIQAHEFQAVPTSGDSGGPLVLATSEGPRVAGIYSQEVMHWLTSATGEKRLFTCNQWEPVQPNLGWIRGVLAGDPGDSEIISCVDHAAILAALQRELAEATPAAASRKRKAAVLEETKAAHGQEAAGDEPAWKRPRTTPPEASRAGAGVPIATPAASGAGD